MLYWAMILTSYVLVVPALLLAFRQPAEEPWLRLMLFLISVYLTNAFLMFNVSNFSPRYIYRLFFLITAVDALGVILLVRAWRENRLAANASSSH